MHKGNKPANSLLFDQDSKLIFAGFADSIIRVGTLAVLFIINLVISRLHNKSYILYIFILKLIVF